MEKEREQDNRPDSARAPDPDARMSANGRRLDVVAFAVVALVITVSWLPTLTSGLKVNPEQDFFLYASRHEAVRKSLTEHRTLPLRSHWFGGGFPTIGEPEDPALNPLVLITIAFGSIMGLKLIAFLAALASGLGTYALARYILDYTRWGALFSALIVGTSLYVHALMWSGNPHEVCPAYLPLCMFLIALACRGRRLALFLLPFVLYTMLSSGKQAFFMAVVCLGVVCALDALPMLRTFSPGPAAGKLDPRALKVLALALGATLLVGMVRVLPLMEFFGSQGGITGAKLHGHEGVDTYGPGFGELLMLAAGIADEASVTTIGWLPIILFVVAACCFWKRSLLWVITLVLFAWLALADKAPIDLFGLLADLPVFSAITLPYKYFAFQILLPMAVGAGQFFWLLRRLRHRWIEHVCAVCLIVGGVVFLYPRATRVQLQTYTRELPSEYFTMGGPFFSIRGHGLERNRVEPPRALTYLNLLQNIGTIDWYVAIPIAENAIPKVFVDAQNRVIPNPLYRGEAFFVYEARPPAATGSGGQAPPASVERWDFQPNSIAVDVVVRSPAILIINQNYHTAWSTDQGELLSGDGMLAVRLEETGSYTVNLSYLPDSFVVGLIVTILSIVGWTVGCWRIGRRTSGGCC